MVRFERNVSQRRIPSHCCIQNLHAWSQLFNEDKVEEKWRCEVLPKSKSNLMHISNKDVDIISFMCASERFSCIPASAIIYVLHIWHVAMNHISNNLHIRKQYSQQTTRPRYVFFFFPSGIPFFSACAGGATFPHFFFSRPDTVRSVFARVLLYTVQTDSKSIKVPSLHEIWERMKYNVQ